jgi:hypothetical protein
MPPCIHLQVPDSVVLFAVGKVVVPEDTDDTKAPRLELRKGSFGGTTLVNDTLEDTRSDDPATVVPFSREDILPTVVAVFVTP